MPRLKIDFPSKKLFLIFFERKKLTKKMREFFAVFAPKRVFFVDLLIAQSFVVEKTGIGFPTRLHNLIHKYFCIFLACMALSLMRKLSIKRMRISSLSLEKKREKTLMSGRKFFGNDQRTFTACNCNKFINYSSAQCGVTPWVNVLLLMPMLLTIEFVVVVIF